MSTPIYSIAERQPEFPCELLITAQADGSCIWSPTLHRETWAKGMKDATHWRPMLPAPNPGQVPQGVPQWAKEAAKQLMELYDERPSDPVYFHLHRWNEAELAIIIARHPSSAPPDSKITAALKACRSRLVDIHFKTDHTSAEQIKMADEALGLFPAHPHSKQEQT